MRMQRTANLLWLIQLSKCLFAALCLLCVSSIVAKPSELIPLQDRHIIAQELVATRARLITSLVPRIAAPIEIDPKQVFALERGGRVAMYVEPVRFQSYDTEVLTHTSYRCGVFILPAEGAATFLPTIGYGQYEPVQCDGLKRVHFKYAKGRLAPPNIEMYYEGSTPHANSEQYVAFSWNAAKKAYFEDQSLE